MRVKKFSLNQLTIRTFIVFWLAFFTMAALLVALPHYDSRLYSDLNQNDISNYQKKLFESIRNNKISNILAGVPVLPVDKFDSYRPVIMTPEQEILGALDKEKGSSLALPKRQMIFLPLSVEYSTISKSQVHLNSILEIQKRHQNYSLCLEQTINKKFYVISLISLGFY